MKTKVNVYQNHKCIDQISIDQIHDYWQKKDCFFWVSMHGYSSGEIEKLSELFELHELATEDVEHGNQRAKIEEYGQSLFCVLHMISDKSLQEDESFELDLFVGKRYLISVEHNPYILNIKNIQNNFTLGEELCDHGPFFIFYLIIDSFVDQYLKVILNMENNLEALENELFVEQGNAKGNIKKLYDFKHRLMLASHIISPLQEALLRLNNSRFLRINQPLQDYFRDVNDHVVRLSRSLESMREMLVIALQVNLALIALEDSHVNKKLSGYAALFAVPTMIAGIYGMNFEYMPELDYPIAYPLVILLMIVADALIYWRLRSLKWL